VCNGSPNYATILLGGCVLRYATHSFYSQLNESHPSHVIFTLCEATNISNPVGLLMHRKDSFGKDFEICFDCHSVDIIRQQTFSGSVTAMGCCLCTKSKEFIIHDIGLWYMDEYHGSTMITIDPNNPTRIMIC